MTEEDKTESCSSVEGLPVLSQSNQYCNPSLTLTHRIMGLMRHETQMDMLWDRPQWTLSPKKCCLRWGIMWRVFIIIADMSYQYQVLGCFTWYRKEEFQKSRFTQNYGKKNQKTCFPMTLSHSQFWFCLPPNTVYCSLILSIILFLHSINRFTCLKGDSGERVFQYALDGYIFDIMLIRAPQGQKAIWKNSNYIRSTTLCKKWYLNTANMFQYFIVTLDVMENMTYHHQQSN